MRKHSKYLKLIGILIILVLPSRVFALNGGLTLTCPSQAKPGDSINCTVNGTSDAVVMALESSVSVDGSATIVSFNRSSLWQSGSLNNDKTLFDASAEDTNATGTFTVGTLGIHVNDGASAGNVTITLSNVKFADAVDYVPKTDGITGGSATFAIVVTEPEPVAKGLSDLTITGGEIIGGFSKSKTAFSVKLDDANISTFAVNALPENSNDSVVCKNNHTDEILNCSNIQFVTNGGNDDMLVGVLVGSGENLVSYSLSVTKPVVNTPELATLVIGGINVPLEEGKYDGYQVELQNVTSYEVSWTLKNADVYQVAELSNPTIRTAPGEFTIIVEPKDKSSGLATKTYYINVVKAGGDSTRPPVTSDPGGNPKTGSSVATFMAIILILSLGASIVLYQKNINGYN